MQFFIPFSSAFKFDLLSLVVALQFVADLCFFWRRSINPGSNLVVEALLAHGASVRGESMLCSFAEGSSLTF
jgi:hypothetical protein